MASQIHKQHPIAVFEPRSDRDIPDHKTKLDQNLTRKPSALRSSADRVLPLPLLLPQLQLQPQQQLLLLLPPTTMATATATATAVSW